MFSDQQVVTGIALLASGYAQLKSGIESYHWQILVYLAWFSSLTHLTTLTILRQYFRKNLVARRWRCFLMLVTVIMLAIAILPTGDSRWLGVTATVPALCFFRRLVSHDSLRNFDTGSITTYSMIISLFVIASGYLVRLVKLSEKATEWSKQWTRTKPGRLLKRMRDHTLKHVKESNAFFPKLWWIPGYVVVETLYILLRASLDVYDSMLWEVRTVSYIDYKLQNLKKRSLTSTSTTLQVLWLFFALAWGTINLGFTRFQHYNTNTENTLSFGQFFPLILLVLPLLNMVETYYGE